MSPSPPAPAAAIGVVMITRDRCDSALSSLERLTRLPEQPPIVVVDNGSSDGTVNAIRRAYPSVRVIPLGYNAGAAGRTVGIEQIATPYVAFADDDSWWAPGALRCAGECFERYPRLAVVAARIFVGPEERLDSVCLAMEKSPVESPRPLPGPAILGFVACGAVVRSEAYLAAGGFHKAFGVGGEEELLAMDLAADGWDLAYVADVVAHHHPSPSRNPERRRRIQARNALWCTWMRRSPSVAAAHTLAAARRSLRDRSSRGALIEALRGLPWVVRQRRRLPSEVEAHRRVLERADGSGAAPLPAAVGGAAIAADAPRRRLE